MKKLARRFLTLKIFGLATSAVADSGDYESSTQFEGEQVPIVITPTRLNQSKYDAPASVSRINADTLHRLQIRTIPEALRYVSGMVVDYASGNQARINYHGTNGLVPRRMQVLIDGISVYRSGYAEITWPVLPVSIDDILYIEVIRSPSSAAYGENSMMAAINIVTLGAESLTRPLISYAASNDKERYAHAAYSTQLNDDLNVLFSASAHHNDGYDENFKQEERHDSFTMKYIRSRVDYQFSEQTSLDVFVAYSEGLNELEYRDGEQLSFPDIDMKAQYYQADLRHVISPHHELDIKAYYSSVQQKVDWHTCRPAVFFLDSLYQLDQSNPSYVVGLFDNDPDTPQGGSTQDDALALQVMNDVSMLDVSPFENVCGNVNEDAVETKLDIEVEDTIAFSSAFRLVYGMGYLREGVQSDTFVNGYVVKDGFRWFSNGEYKLGGFTANLGFMAEEEPQVKRVEYSPRLGLNYTVSPALSLRYAISKAVRTPDILETDRDWRYEMTEASPAVNGETDLLFFKRAQSTDSLASEEIISNEIGMYGRSFIGRSNLEYDVKVFYDRLSNLISEKQQYFDYNPSNDGRTTLKGVEFEFDAAIPLSGFVNRADLHINYARLVATTNNFYEKSLHPDHVGAAFLILNMNRGWYSSLAYYGNSAINGESYDGYELGGGKRTIVGGAHLDTAIKWVYQPDLEHAFTVSERFNVENNHTSPSTIMARVKYEF